MDKSQDDINTESLGSKEIIISKTIASETMKWVRILEELKEKQVRSSPDPNIPVTIYAGKADKYIIASIAMSDENPDPKYQGLFAAGVLKVASDPDLIVFISDTYFTDDEKFRGTSLNEEYEKGNRNVRESLTCVSINKDKEISVIILPYAYGGNNIIIWEEPMITGSGEGFVTSRLIQIMCMPLLIDKTMLQAITGLDREKQIYHATRAAVQFLRDKGFTVTGDV
jgi:hypothetical protein